jgi:two-component system chemotaxis response regulator CheB
MATPPADSPLEARHARDFALVVIGSSAGGLRALRQVLDALPAELPASILVVQHLAPWHRSHLAHILDSSTKLDVKEAEEGDVIRSGGVYVAPPNKHLLVNPDGTLSLSFSEMVHFLRPSADLLFESAAASFKDRTIGVVLTGTGSDGAMGVSAIKRMGGLVIAQDEATSEFSGMPLAAIGTGTVDFILPLNGIAPKLRQLIEGDTLDE